MASLYLTIFYTKQAGFRFEIVSEGPVYDIKENLSKLEVLFDGEDIRKNQQELSFISIRVTNDGNSDLSKGAFDDDALPRFTIPNSRIITIEPLAASSRYLKEHSEILPVGSNEGVISPVIIDQGEHFAFRLLVLHPQQQRPQIQITGKIEGIKELTLTRFVPPEATTFLQRTFNGDIFVQGARFGAYMIGGVLAIVFIGISFEKISFWRTKRKRKKIVQKFEDALDTNLPQKVSCVLKHYEAWGERIIITTCGLLRDSDELRKAIQLLNDLPKAEPSDPESDFYVFQDQDGIRNLRYPRRRDSFVIRTLVDEGIVTVSSEQVTVDPQSLYLLSRFESFLLAFSTKKAKRVKPELMGTAKDSQAMDESSSEEAAAPKVSSSNHE